MQELSDNARVWCVYNDEAAKFDAELVKRWIGTLHTQILFVSEF
jgi:hypothetical protein